MTEVKTRGYLSEDCLSLQLYKARNAASNSSASVFGQLAWEVKTATRSQNCIWPGWLFSVLKTQTQSSSALGEEVKGEEKKKKTTESSTLVFPPWQPVAFDRWHMQFTFILLYTCSTNKSSFPVILCHGVCSKRNTAGIIIIVGNTTHPI